MNIKKTKRKIKKKKEMCQRILTIVGIIFIAAFIMLVLRFNFLYFLEIGNMELGVKAGEVGDIFGFSNALFSGLAFLGLIVTIFMQNKELKMQREELELQRKEMKGQKEQLGLQREEMEGQKEQLKLQREEMQKQNKVMVKQSFDNTFFKLLDTIIKLEENIEYSDCGRKGIERIWEQIEIAYKRDYKNNNNFGSCYNETVRKLETWKHLEGFLSTIKNIIFFIKKSNLSLNEKQEYAKIILSYLSQKEKIIFFYYYKHDDRRVLNECMKDLDPNFAKKIDLKYFLEPKHKELVFE